MNRAFRIFRKVILVSLTCVTFFFAALWLLVTFAPSLGHGHQIQTANYFITNLHNGGWWGSSVGNNPITWQFYVRPEFVSVQRITNDRISHQTMGFDIKLTFRRFGVRHKNNDGYPYTSIAFPFWFVVATIGAYPSLVLIKSLFLRWRRRRNPNYCSNCNYNLTGNVSGVCPECGTNCVCPSKEATGEFKHVEHR